MNIKTQLENMEPLLDKVTAYFDILQAVEMDSLINTDSINILVTDGFMAADKLRAQYDELYDSVHSQEKKAAV